MNYHSSYLHTQVCGWISNCHQEFPGLHEIWREATKGASEYFAGSTWVVAVPGPLLLQLHCSISCLPSWTSHPMQRKDILKLVVNMPDVCLNMWEMGGWRNEEKRKWNSLYSRNEFSAYMEEETQAEHLICCINIPLSSLINQMEYGWLIQ